MAIRIRTVCGVRVALCAVESDPFPGDVYLDDSDHHALAAKFASDWQGQTIDWAYPSEWAAMATQKLRDAKTELVGWLSTTQAETDPATLAVPGDVVEQLWQELLEKDDRTSPAEYPDMALITFDEFCAALAAASQSEGGK